MTEIESKAIDNYIETLEQEAYEDIEAGYVQDGEAKLKEAHSIQSLNNAIESALNHGFIQNSYDFIAEFAE